MESNKFSLFSRAPRGRRSARAERGRAGRVIPLGVSLMPVRQFLKYRRPLKRAAPTAQPFLPRDKETSRHSRAVVRTQGGQIVIIRANNDRSAKDFTRGLNYFFRFRKNVCGFANYVWILLPMRMIIHSVLSININLWLIMMDPNGEGSFNGFQFRTNKNLIIETWRWGATRDIDIDVTLTWHVAWIDINISVWAANTMKSAIAFPLENSMYKIRRK